MESSNSEPKIEVSLAHIDIKYFMDQEYRIYNKNTGNFVGYVWDEKIDDNNNVLYGKGKIQTKRRKYKLDEDNDDNDDDI
jgi:hypothetical protein